jgi:hypothetical protein
MTQFRDIQSNLMLHGIDGSAIDYDEVISTHPLRV